MTSTPQTEMHQVYLTKWRKANQMLKQLSEKIKLAEKYPNPDWGNIGDMENLCAMLTACLFALEVEGRGTSRYIKTH